MYGNGNPGDSAWGSAAADPQAAGRVTVVVTYKKAGGEGMLILLDVWQNAVDNIKYNKKSDDGERGCKARRPESVRPNNG
uniref:Uncharacterized protein n=1 Tax=Romanomermis culicivorax TaxID=13658 RepID=A0A915I6K9_ROMCU